MSKFILALDQGTTSSRAILFDHAGQAVASDQAEFEQILPKPGHVEHDAEEIWRTQLAVAQHALKVGNVDPAEIAAIGITNQRETTVLWERDSGKPVANAIVWQSRVSGQVCQRLKEQGGETLVRERTGLLLDPYFSGTKIRHLLDTHGGLRERAEGGEILFGTIDTFLLWRLTGGRVHATDVSNASRTLLLNIHTCEWDDELLELIGVPRAMLPEVKPSSCLYGETDEEHFGRAIPIGGIAGDQQAATFGQACFEVGSVKNTYGTGCFMLMNTGNKPVASENRLLTTVGWQLEGENPVYCLEGSVFIAGAVVQWLRDGLGIIESSAEVEELAATVDDADGVYLVPAFTGLGAPHWDPQARGAILGITRGTTAGHIARAALDSMAYQTRDLVVAMQNDAGHPLAELKVDGGASVNDSLMQFQANLLDCKVVRPVVPETTALGAAYLAGLAVGFWESTDEVIANWQLDREFTPAMSAETRQDLCDDWHRAVKRSLGWEESDDD